jgi:hypothetical protein
VKPIITLFLLSFLLFGCADEEIRPAAASSEVFVINCIEAVSQPAELVLYCADAGQILTQVSWTSWGEATAKGIGNSISNTCDPSCAEGVFETVAVEVTLSDLVQSEGRLIYTKANLIYSQPVFGVLEETIDLPVQEFR